MIVRPVTTGNLKLKAVDLRYRDCEHCTVTMGGASAMVLLSILSIGCGKDEIRSDNAKGLPIVNPLAPGARAGLKNPVAGETQFISPPGYRSGIPK